MRPFRFFQALIVFGLFLTVCGLSPAVYADETVRIAFLDSGVSTKHLSASQISGGQNFVFPENDTNDRTGHGTETAGIVLGSKDGTVPGIFPQAVIVPLVCSDRYPSGVSERVSAEGVAKAVYAAVDTYSCRVINISLGFSEDFPSLREAVEYAEQKDVLIVAAVGNDHESNPDKTYYPAAYDSVIGVGCAQNGSVASFSQRHGVNLVTDSRFLTVGNKNSENCLVRVGTSYACAYISGLCGRLRALYPSLSAKDIRALLYRAATDIEAVGFDADSGYGYLPAVDFRLFRSEDISAERSSLFPPQTETSIRLAVYDRLKGKKADPDAVVLTVLTLSENPPYFSLFLPALLPIRIIPDTDSR